MAKHETTIIQTGEIVEVETPETAAVMAPKYPAPVEVLPIAATPMALIERAISSGAGMDTIERLLAMHERLEETAKRKAFDGAISSAKGEIGPIAKNRMVDFTNKSGQRTAYAFEDLAEIARTVDPVLSKFGLSYRYRTTQTGCNVRVACVVSHRDGYSEETALEAPADTSGSKNSIQAVGSTITFLQRYTLKSALGLSVASDDDGRTAEPQAEDAAPAELTARQAAELRRLVEETGTDLSLFLKAAKATAIEDITPAAFEKLKARLLEKKAKAAVAAE